MEPQKEDSIIQLISFLGEELRQEIVINEDSSGFWLKAQAHIFENSVASVRENIKSLSETVTQDPDLYNYMSTFVFRVFSQPFTRGALDQFCKGFDEISIDHFFREGFGFTSSSMTLVEKFLLFVTVHRNQIQMVMLEVQTVLEQKRLAEVHARRGKTK